MATNLNRMQQLPGDVIDYTLMNCAFTGDCRSIQAFGMTDKFFNEKVKAFIKQLPLDACCPRLKIVDAQSLGCVVTDEPAIDKCAVIDSYYVLLPDLINDGHSALLLTICKGSTVAGLFMKTRDGSGVASGNSLVNVCQTFPKDASEGTYRILILSGVSSESVNKNYGKQMEFAIGKGCELPTLRELMALCAYDGKRQCLLRKIKTGKKDVNGEILEMGKVMSTTVCTSTKGFNTRIWCVQGVSIGGQFKVSGISLEDYNNNAIALGGTGCILVRKFF